MYPKLPQQKNKEQKLAKAIKNNNEQINHKDQEKRHNGV